MHGDVFNTTFIQDDNETPEETVARLAGVTGSRLGYGRAIELVMPEICKVIQDTWHTLIPDDFKVGWLPQLKNNAILKETPDLGPENPDTNIQNLDVKTTDSPTTSFRESIRFTPVRAENAGFARKIFSGTKELKPRFRFQIAKTNSNGLLEYTYVLAKTNEYMYEFNCFGRDGATANFLYKCFEYICYTNAKLFLEFGLQRAIPMGSPRRPDIDNASKMHRRVLSVYFRHEEYYYRPGEVELTSLDYNWDEFQLLSET